MRKNKLRSRIRTPIRIRVRIMRPVEINTRGKRVTSQHLSRVARLFLISYDNTLQLFRGVSTSLLYFSWFICLSQIACGKCLHLHLCVHMNLILNARKLVRWGIHYCISTCLQVVFLMNCLWHSFFVVATLLENPWTSLNFCDILDYPGRSWKITDVHQNIVSI